MAKRYPLVYDEVNDIVEQLPDGDYIEAGLDGIDVQDDNSGTGLSKADAVNLYNSGGLKARKAIADGGGFYRCYGFAADNIGANATGVIQLENKLDGFSGLTPGASYYLDPTTSGAITSNLGLFASGDYVQKVGYAISATELYIEIGNPIRLR